MTADTVERTFTTSTNKPDSSHIVMVPPDETDETPQAYVLRARIEGFPITALCGFTWVPRQPATGLPVCQECLDLYQNDPTRSDGREELPHE